MKSHHGPSVALFLINILCALSASLQKSTKGHVLDGSNQQLQPLKGLGKSSLRSTSLHSGAALGDGSIFDQIFSVAYGGVLIQPSQAAPSQRKALYFRPVSVTLWCVMILTIESLCIYTGLALLRNADELGARSTPSVATETFAAASRTSVFPSMLCMLFVAFRMYVLATTEGLGEPQLWAKLCMCAATAGLTLQFVIVFALAFLTKTPAEEEDKRSEGEIRTDDKSISALSGGHHDVHPLLDAHEYHDVIMGDALQKTQIVSLVLVYGGVLGVLFGVAAFPRQSTQISPTVMCTCIMSFAYFCVYLYLWCVRKYTEMKISNAEQALLATEADHRKREADILAEIKGETGVDESSVVDTEIAAGEDLAEPFSESDIEESGSKDPTKPKRELSEASIRLSTRHRELQRQIDSKKQLFQDRHRDLAVAVRAHQEFVKQARSTMLTKHDVSLKGAAMNMSMSIKKAPMLAILFLAARMRALQVDPPYGMPPVWAQCCFATITVALIGECLCAAFIGYTGKERRGYYGAYLYHASHSAHIAQHACAFVTYTCLVPIVVAIYRMRYPGEYEPAPLSPTVKCVLYFELLYFGISIGWWCTSFAEEILDRMDDKVLLIQQTLLAAGVSVTFTPMLCVLFVATRMRSLQITQQQGNPPNWAQDCMFMCVFATCVQVLCCLLMPIFTGEKSEVDGDGNVKYDLNPMAGAYFVTVIKYIALFMLHGGVVVICIAVFTMTPDMCMEPTETVFNVWKMAKMMALFCLISLFGLLLSSAKVVGLAIKFALESCDEAMLGTTIEVKTAALSILEGYVNVQGLNIKNPGVVEEGVQIPDPWSSECLAQVDKLKVKINMWRLIKSLGNEFEITAIMVQGFQFNYEKWSLMRASNVDMILQHLQDGGLAPSTDDAQEVVQEEVQDDTIGTQEDLVIEVEKVSIADINANGYLKGVPLVAKVADIEYENFTKEFGGTVGSVGAIVSILLKSILMSIVANFSNVGGGLISGVAHGVEAVAMAPIHGVQTVAGAVFGLFSGHDAEEHPESK